MIAETNSHGYHHTITDIAMKIERSKLEPCKQSEDNFIANRMFTSFYNVKTVNRLWKKKCICYFLWILHDRG